MVEALTCFPFDASVYAQGWISYLLTTKSCRSSPHAARLLRPLHPHSTHVCENDDVHNLPSGTCYIRREAITMLCMYINIHSDHSETFRTATGPIDSGYQGYRKTWQVEALAKDLNQDHLLACLVLDVFC